MRESRTKQGQKGQNWRELFLADYEVARAVELSQEVKTAIVNDDRFWSLLARYFLDFLLNFFVFGIPIVGFWRGVWYAGNLLLESIFGVSISGEVWGVY